MLRKFGLVIWAVSAILYLPWCCDILAAPGAV
jgi:hypothetical protein